MIAAISMMRRLDTVPHLLVTVSEIFQARFNSLIELEAALTDFDVPTFAVEEHRLPPT